MINSMLYIIIVILLLFSPLGCGSAGTSEVIGSGAKDNGGLSTIIGTIQKGPVILGSSVSIQELNDMLKATGLSFNTQTINDNGDFSLEVPIVNGYVDVMTSGYYLDELSGSLSSGQITLHSVSPISSDTIIKVNIFTDIARLRIKKLVTDGMDFSNAELQARWEVLKAFGITPAILLSAGILEKSVSFDKMDIMGTSYNDAILLATSATCLKIAHERSLGEGNIPAHLLSLLSSIAIDIEQDGILSDTLIVDEIITAQKVLDTESIKNNLQNHYSSVGTTITAPPFEQFIDSDGDGKLNVLDFLLGFESVKTNSLNSFFTSNAISIILPIDTTEVASIDSGTIVLNGIDTGETSVQVQNGDNVAIRLESASEYLQMQTITSSTMIIARNQGTYEITTEYPQPILKKVFNAGIMVSEVFLSPDQTRLYISGWRKDVHQFNSPAFQILDVSDPDNPTLLGTYDLGQDGLYKIHALSEDGNIAYLGRYHNDDNMILINVSNPSSPYVAGKYNLKFSSLILSGKNAYVTGGYGLHILDISNITSITSLGYYDIASNCKISGKSRCEPVDIATSKDGNTVYLSSYWGGIIILDVKDKTTPTLIKHYNPDNLNFPIYSLNLLSDNITLIASTPKGLQIINVSNTSSPFLLGSYNRGQGNGGYREFTLSADEKRVYAAGANTGMDEISISNLNAPVLLGKYHDVINNESPQVRGLAINKEETLAFVGMEKDGLSIVGINGN